MLSLMHQLWLSAQQATTIVTADGKARERDYGLDRLGAPSDLLIHCLKGTNGQLGAECERAYTGATNCTCYRRLRRKGVLE